MKRISLSAMFLFLFASFAQAAIDLRVGDTVKFNTFLTSNGTTDAPKYYSGPGQTLEAAGNGGAFDFQLIDYATPVAPNRTSKNQHFNTFCVELTQNINFGGLYTVYDGGKPTAGVTANSSGKILRDLSGIALFEAWSSGGLFRARSTTLTTNHSDIAGAVQVAIWESLGYSQAQIASEGGITTDKQGTYNNQISLWLADNDIMEIDGLWTGNTTSGWTNLNYGVAGSGLIWLSATDGQHQDQLALVNNAGGLVLVPEPASVIVWSLLGLTTTSIAIVRRRRNLKQCG